MVCTMPDKPSRLVVFGLKNDEPFYFDADRRTSDYLDLLVAFAHKKKAIRNHYKKIWLL